MGGFCFWGEVHLRNFKTSQSAPCMPKRPSLRIDLGPLDTHFERFAAAKGQPVSAALGEVLAQYLAQDKPQTPSPRKRVFRRVNFTSFEEQEQARKKAKGANQELGPALRKVALEQLLAHLDMVQSGGTGTVSAGVPSGGVAAKVGETEAGSLRLELKLNASEMATLEERAKAGRYRSVQALVIGITRAFLFNAPVLDPVVAGALGRENLELVRISNYIGQLTRDVAAGKRLGALDAADVIAMVARVEAHTQTVAKALANAQGRWALQNVAKVEGTESKEGVGDGNNG
jgi:hypothetical protein